MYVRSRDTNASKRRSLSGLGGPRRNKSGAAFVKPNEADDRRARTGEHESEREKTILSPVVVVSFPSGDLCVSTFRTSPCTPIVVVRETTIIAGRRVVLRVTRFRVEKRYYRFNKRRERAS